MSTTTISIEGMTCGHCVGAVTDELKSLDGVQDVSITLNAGGISTATIGSSTELDPSNISEAVAEAGYTVVARNA